MLCFWICCGFYCLVVFLFDFPLCLFYSLCPLWLWYFENQQVNSFTETTQCAQHKGLTQSRKFHDHLCICQILKTGSTDWSSREKSFRNDITNNEVSESFWVRLSLIIPLNTQLDSQYSKLCLIITPLNIKEVNLHVFFAVDERSQTHYLATLTPVSILREKPVWAPHSQRAKLWRIENCPIPLRIETWSQDRSQNFFVSELSRISLRNMRSRIKVLFIHQLMH
jgi:hypothetical protein